jgi:hypothetical protein
VVAAELPLGARGAVEDELRGLVVSEPRLPAFLVSRGPEGFALRTARDQRDAFDRPGARLRLQKESGRATGSRQSAPLSAFARVPQSDPCRTHVLPANSWWQNAEFACPVSEAVFAASRAGRGSSDQGAPGSRAHQALPPPQNRASCKF